MKMKHKFVKFIPDSIESGILYISIDYLTAIHLCCCGCNKEVVTPISPDDWTLKFNGETISLSPSIGNWEFECQSHYWIKNNRVVWDQKWQRERILENRNNKELEEKPVPEKRYKIFNYFIKNYLRKLTNKLCQKFMK